ncbi:MAG: ANTAR domain-containing protein [Pseudomonadota bacterium]
MKPTDLSVMVVDENRLRASMIRDGLFAAGCREVTIVSDLKGLVAEIERTSPSVIVMDIESPDRDRLEDYFAVSRSVKKPIAMFVDKSDPSWMEAAIDAGVSSYVVDGLRPDRVKPILDMAIARFEAFRRMEQELERTKDELSGRKLVDKAKGILMKSKGISEQEAHQLLRNAAMNQNRKMSEVAQGLITASGLLDL